MTTIAWVVGALLCIFTARRYLFWLATLLPRRATPPDRSRTITVLVAARNEALSLPHLLCAFERLDYPPELLDFVIVDDASIDGTAAIARAWVETRSSAHVLVLPERGGKAAALQTALDHARATDLVAIIDADAIPAPDALAVLAGAFRDDAVGGACGFPDPGTEHRSIVARYTALERWVSHLVTFAGKDRLGLQPPVIGALCCLRRSALDAIGGIPLGTMAEDIELSLALSHAGWRTRWLREAHARENVPGDLQALRAQRLRWSRGLMASGKRSRGPEEILAAPGYLDRLVLLAGAGLAAVSDFPLWPLVAYVATPIVVVLTALLRANPRGKPLYLLSIVPMALVDIAITLESAAAQLTGRKLSWERIGRDRQ